MKSTALLIERINAIKEGKVFTYSDLHLPKDKQAAAAMSLSRMVAANYLKKIGKGKFYKPAYSPLGEMTPLIDEQTKDLLIRNGKPIGYVTGIPAFAQMGLTSQISSNVLIGSRIYRRPLIRGGYVISFTRQENEITEKNIPLLRYLDALRFIKKIPACTPDKAVDILLQTLSSIAYNEIDSLINLAASYSPSTRALLGAMLEYRGLDTTSLEASINPLTQYKIGISDHILPTKSKWNIQ